jgi:hypothetical protein
MSRAAARTVSVPRVGIARAMPKNVHLVPGRSRRACGSPSGAFIVLNAAGRAYLKKFLARGGGLCAECAKQYDGGKT